MPAPARPSAWPVAPAGVRSTGSPRVRSAPAALPPLGRGKQPENLRLFLLEVGRLPALDTRPICCRLVVVGGGVTANKILRSALEKLGEQHRAKILIPPIHLCTDNAAMGAIAWEHIERNEIADLELDVLPNVYRKKKQQPKRRDASHR